MKKLTRYDEMKRARTKGFYRDIGKNIFRYRNRNKLTQRELERRLGLPKGSISKIENNRRLPSVSELMSIAHELNTSISKLVKRGIYGDQNYSRL